MDVSYNCELNLSTDFEPTYFKEATSHDEWNEVTQKEYDALINNGTWNLVDPPLGTKPIRCKWVYKTKYKVDGYLTNTKPGLWQKVLHRKNGLIMRRHFPSQQNGLPSRHSLPWQLKTVG